MILNFQETRDVADSDRRRASQTKNAGDDHRSEENGGSARGVHGSRDKDSIVKEGRKERTVDMFIESSAMDGRFLREKTTIKGRTEGGRTSVSMVAAGGLQRLLARLFSVASTFKFQLQLTTKKKKFQLQITTKK